MSRFKTLILPSIAALSDAQCDQLRAFVRNGGSVIATYETSLCDEWGVRRKDFGLADLFGVGWTGRTEGPMQNSYLRLEHAAAPGHPLFRGLEDAPRIVNGGWRLDVEPREKFAQVPLTLIPGLSRSADGKSLSASREYGHPGSFSARIRPGPRRLFSVGH